MSYRKIRLCVFVVVLVEDETVVLERVFGFEILLRGVKGFVDVFGL